MSFLLVIYSRVSEFCTKRKKELTSFQASRKIIKENWRCINATSKNTRKKNSIFKIVTLQFSLAKGINETQVQNSARISFTNVRQQKKIYILLMFFSFCIRNMCDFKDDCGKFIDTIPKHQHVFRQSAWMLQNIFFSLQGNKFSFWNDVVTKRSSFAGSLFSWNFTVFLSHVCCVHLISFFFFFGAFHIIIIIILVFFDTWVQAP